MQLFYQLNYVRCLHLMYLKIASTVRIELTHGLLESLSPNPWNIGGYKKIGSLIRSRTEFAGLKIQSPFLLDDKAIIKKLVLMVGVEPTTF